MYECRIQRGGIGRHRDLPKDLNNNEAMAHLHATSITRIHNLLGQLQERLPHERPRNIEYGRCAFDVVSIFLLHSFHHSFYNLAVRDIGRYANGFPPILINLVDDGIVGIWNAGEEGNGVRRSKFAGDCCTGLEVECQSIGFLDLGLGSGTAGEEEWTYARADSGDDGNGFRHVS